MSWQGMKNLEKLHLNKINSRIQEIESRFIWTDKTVVKDVAASVYKPHITIFEAKRLRYKPVKDSFSWGEPWGTCWFRLRFRIPAHFRNQPVVLKFVTGGECLIYRDDKPVQALDRGRDQYVLTDRAHGGERIELYVEAGAQGDFGDYQKRVMRSPEISILNWEV